MYVVHIFQLVLLAQLACRANGSRPAVPRGPTRHLQALLSFCGGSGDPISLLVRVTGAAHLVTVENLWIRIMLMDELSPLGGG